MEKIHFNEDNTFNYHLNKLTIKEIMMVKNLTIKELSDKFNIPYRTVQNWVSGISTPPQYVVNMIFDVLNQKDIECIENMLLEHYDNVLDRASDLLHDGRYKEAMSLIDNA